MRVAVLKPDHLGDMILAAPAIAALRRRFRELTLLCHSETLPLADRLFAGLSLRPIHLPHLDRTRCQDPDSRPLRELRGCYDLIVALRWDPQIKSHLDDSDIPYQASERDGLDVHVAVEQRDLLTPCTGHYDIQSSYAYPGAPPAELPRQPRAIGLCIAAGYPLNAWPLNHWLGLAERLARCGVEIVFIGGPQETVRLRILADALAASVGRTPRVLCGNQDFGQFLRALAGSVEVVIASDSGTAHLASLVRPILSIFGGSPWRRFAPLGEYNAIVTRQLPCSPCPQFDRQLMNACSTRECLANLLPAQVEACLEAHLEGRTTVRPRHVQGVWLTCAPWKFSRNALAERRG
jgi:heptosyltransferase-2